MVSRRPLFFGVPIVALALLALVPTATAQTTDSKAGASATDTGAAGVTLMNSGLPPVSSFAVGNMTYHGGPVMRGPMKVYTIFWLGPSASFPQAGYQTTINQFVNDLNNTPYFGIASQYFDSVGSIGTAVSLGGTWLDAVNNFPSSNLSFSDLQAEVTRASTANGWVADANSYFQIYTPPGIFSSIGGICGLHWFASPIGQILYPQPGCYPGGPYPNSQDADSAINTSAHEIMETATDPAGNAWFFVDASGEIGDMCNFVFGTRAGDGSNVTLNGHKYVVQQEWSNASSGCVIGFVANTPTPTNTPTNTPTSTPTPNRATVVALTQLAAITPTSTPFDRESPYLTQVAASSSTPTRTPTLTVTVTPSITLTPGCRDCATATTTVTPTGCSSRGCSSGMSEGTTLLARADPGIDIWGRWSQLLNSLGSWLGRQAQGA